MTLSSPGDVISKNATITAIATSSVKPSFLLWDKVYQKVTEESEEKWLLRVVEVALRHFQKDLKKSDVLRYDPFSPLSTLNSCFDRTNFGSVLLHLALNSSHKDIRQATNNVIKDAAVWDPELTTALIRETVVAFLSLGSTAKVAPSDETASTRDKHARLAVVLLSAVPYEESVQADVKERLVTDLIVVAHHELACEFL